MRCIVDGVPTAESSVRWRTREDFDSDAEYGGYIQSSLVPGMRVRARRNMDLGHWEVGSEVKAGDVGRYLYNHTTFIDGCTDEREDCELLSSLGDCELFSYVRRVCRLSCGECVPAVQQASPFPCVVEWHGAGAEYNQRGFDWNVPSPAGEGISSGYQGMPWVHASQWHEIEIIEPPRQLGQLCPLEIRSEAAIQAGSSTPGVAVVSEVLPSLSTSLPDRTAIYRVDYMLPVPGQYKVEVFQYMHRGDSEKNEMVFALLHGLGSTAIVIDRVEPEPEPEAEPLDLPRTGWEDLGCRAASGHGSGKEIEVLRRIPTSSNGETSEILRLSTPCPAVSCQQIQQDYPLAPSGEYWIREDDPTPGSWLTPADGPSTQTVLVTCDMTISPFFTQDELVAIYSDLYMAHLRALDNYMGFHSEDLDTTAHAAATQEPPLTSPLYCLRAVGGLAYKIQVDLHSLPDSVLEIYGGLWKLLGQSDDRLDREEAATADPNATVLTKRGTPYKVWYANTTAAERGSHLRWTAPHTGEFQLVVRGYDEWLVQPYDASAIDEDTGQAILSGERLDPTVTATVRAARSKEIPMTGSFQIAVVVDSADPSEVARAAEAAAQSAQCSAPGGAPGRRIGRVDQHQSLLGTNATAAAARAGLGLPAPKGSTVCKQDAAGVESGLGPTRTGLSSDSPTTEASLQLLTDCSV